MANPQKEHGYTALANEIMDQLCKVELTSSEQRVLFAILRKTYGFQKKKDAISLSQFVETTELSKRGIIYTLQDLEAKKMIFIDRLMDDGAKMTNVIAFNKNYEEWVVHASALQKIAKREADSINPRGSARKPKVVQPSALPPLVHENAKGSARFAGKVVHDLKKNTVNRAHTKENKRNKEIQKGKAPPAVRDKTGRFVKKAGKEIAIPEGTLTGEEWQELIDAWQKVNEFYLNFYKNKTQRQAISELVKKVGKEKLLWVVNRLHHTNKISFFPAATTPAQLRDKWSAINDAYIKKKAELSGAHRPDTQKVDRFTK